MAEKNWLNKIIEKYGNSGTADHSTGSYEWKNGGNGGDSDGDGKKEYDCSHFLTQVLQDMGYNNPYQNTPALNKNSSYYDGIDKANLQKGDIVLFNGHVGFFYGYDEKGNMLLYSSSGNPTKGTDRGPAITPASWFGNPTKFLRPKPTPLPSIPIGSIKKKVSTASVTTSPIILDLNGDGIKTLGTDAGIHFDHDGNGFKELSGWVAPGDGVLMLDRDLDDILDNGSELFGNFTPLANGMLAVNGFQALAQFDTNGDGKIDASDPIWSQLKVWQHDPEATDAGDPDSSGIFSTLDDLGIQSINTGYANSTFVDANGNAHKEIGTFTWNNGTTNSAEDVWFKTDNMYTIANEWLDVPEDIAELPDLQGYGNVYDLQQAMVRDTSGALKGLVEQFAAETDADARHSLITQILYKWAGVENVDPNSRAATRIYGNVIGDARKLATLEAFMGENYYGTWCWGERDPNPHGPASKILLRAFDELAGSIYSQLMAQTHFKDLFSTISVTWNSETEQVEWDVSATGEALQALYITNPDNAPLAMSEFTDSIPLTDEARTLANMRRAGAVLELMEVA